MGLFSCEPPPPPEAPQISAHGRPSSEMAEEIFKEIYLFNSFSRNIGVLNIE